MFVCKRILVYLVIHNTIIANEMLEFQDFLQNKLGRKEKQKRIDEKLSMS